MKIRRIVVKLGTTIVIEESEGRPACERLRSIVSDIIEIRAQGIEVVVVTSGAIGLGRNILREDSATRLRDRSLVEKQVSATVGQPALMQLWAGLFAEKSALTAQLLLTALDFERRESYLNVHATIDELLLKGIIPIINENDATSVREIREDSESSFGDNDRLSAIVASRIGAQRLVILTSTDGVFTANPETDSHAAKIAEVPSIQQLERISTLGTSSGGRGGMKAKLAAVKIAALCGVTVHISSGFIAPQVSRALLKSEGTTVKGAQAEPSRKSWIGHSSGYRGIVTVNEGAKNALLLLGASLLPVGITEVRGEFGAGEVIRVNDEVGSELGRGVVNYDSRVLTKIAGLRTPEVAAVLGDSYQVGSQEEAIHRNNLVLFVHEHDGE